MAEKTEAEKRKEAEEKAKKDAEKDTEKKDGDEPLLDYEPEEREPTLDDLQLEVHAAEAHERLANKRKLEEFQHEQKVERELQGEEVADEARERLAEEEEKFERTMADWRGDDKFKRSLEEGRGEKTPAKK